MTYFPPKPTALSVQDRQFAARLADDAAKRAAAEAVVRNAGANRVVSRQQSTTTRKNKAEIEAAGDNAIAAAALGFPANWSTVMWNPPVHRATSGAFVGAVDKKEGMGNLDRASVLGTNSIRDRRALKGVIYQHIQHPEEWEIPDENLQTLSDNGGGNFEKTSGQDGTRYGFRFHYNPSTIDFGISLNGDFINPALIISGAAQSMPITPGQGSPTVRVQFFLNRMEDMTLLARNRVDPDVMAKYRNDRDKWESSGGTGVRPTRPIEPMAVTAEQLRYFYGRNLTEKEKDGIYDRGTGYDLEFLFRAVLGRPWDTLLRGNTADVGIAFGMPLILDLSVQQDPGGGPAGTGGNRYLGRLSSISYSHLSFDHRMVPIWTQCAMDFMRYPDAKPQGGKKAPLYIADPLSVGDFRALESAAAAAAEAATAGASPNKFGGGGPERFGPGLSIDWNGTGMPTPSHWPDGID